MKDPILFECGRIVAFEALGHRVDSVALTDDGKVEALWESCDSGPNAKEHDDIAGTAGQLACGQRASAKGDVLTRSKSLAASNESAVLAVSFNLMRHKRLSGSGVRNIIKARGAR